MADSHLRALERTNNPALRYARARAGLCGLCGNKASLWRALRKMLICFACDRKAVEKHKQRMQRIADLKQQVRLLEADARG